MQQSRIHGFSSLLAYYPEEGVTIGVLSNLENSLPERIADVIAAIAVKKAEIVPY
ncbi:hypothetical protein [cf. Phormidesmis sp. LEGE 11477]|uniref:hypothetical protein n=1 Tax=cf. Phormidesmis sp. LEGE 11477 TaxID=1828680 RepID=UPI001D145AA6|nr:hypothetical protein [cf. Phormidesmis sp. LEGE 11477]